MVVLATGHQVRCIVWEQVVILKKRQAFYVDYFFLAFIIVCEEYLQPRPMVYVVDMLKITVKCANE